MIGISLAACVAIALAPIWLSWEKAGDGEADQTIWFVQSRAAAARFERDLREASPVRCPFAGEAAVLEATPTQIVLLEADGDASAPLLVEWEIVKGAMMRRWTRCPAQRPVAFAHSMYVDSKTMLENVRTGGGFAYYSGARRLVPPLDAVALRSLTRVVLQATGAIPGVPGHVDMRCVGRVGR
jgi:hypothetical protein